MSLFNSVKGLHPKKHKFNLSHDNLISHDMGVIVPCFVWNDLIPGSRARVSVNQLTRMQALIAPIMNNVDAYVQFWKIPYRILDPSWTRFISGELEINELTYDPPYFTYTGLSNAFSSLYSKSLQDYLFSGSLLDFLGYPMPDACGFTTAGTGTSGTKLTIRPIQSYCMILRYWYINENIIDPSIKPLIDIITYFCPDPYDANNLGYFEGDVSDQVAILLKYLKDLSPSQCFPHAWGKDYFTSATIPVTGAEPVRDNLTGSPT